MTAHYPFTVLFSSAHVLFLHLETWFSCWSLTRTSYVRVRVTPEEHRATRHESSGSPPRPQQFAGTAALI